MPRLDFEWWSILSLLKGTGPWHHAQFCFSKHVFINSTHRWSSLWRWYDNSFLLLGLLLEEIKLLRTEDRDGSGASHNLGADVLAETGSVALVAITFLTLASLGGTHADSA